jgi:hypothetical protein
MMAEAMRPAPRNAYFMAEKLVGSRAFAKTVVSGKRGSLGD